MFRSYIKKQFSLLILSLVCSFPLAASAQQGGAFVAEVDSTSVALGDSVNLSLQFQGADEPPAPPELPPIEGVEVVARPPSTQNQTSIEIVNGRMRQTKVFIISYNYTLTPSRLGKFVIPSVKIKVNGREYSTQPITIQVVEAIPQEHVLLSVTADKSEVYLNEQVLLTFRLSIDDPSKVLGYDCTIPWLTALEGFVAEPPKEFLEGLKGNQRLSVRSGTEAYEVLVNASAVKDANRSGKQYVVYSLSKPLFPTTHGERKIPACTFKCQYGQRRRVMDDFFGFGMEVAPRNAQTIFARSNDLILKVKPLPTEGRPAAFCDAVGEFKMEVNIEPTQVRAYDPITLKIKISGTGDVQGIKPPVLGDTTGFKSYTGDTKSVLGREGGRIKGTKTFTQILEPQSPNVKEVPAVAFAYFNPKLGRYETLRQGPFPIQVLPVEREKPLVVSAPATPPAAKGAVIELTKDLMPLATDFAGLTNQAAPLCTNKVILGILPLPWILAGIAYVLQRRRERLRFDQGYARACRAMRAARKKLSEVKRRVASTPSKQLCGDLARTISEFIADKLNLPPASVTAESASELLAQRGVEAEVLQAIKALYEECDRARFSPAEMGPASADLLGKTEQLLRRLDRALKRHTRGNTGISLLLAAGLVAFATESRCQSAPLPQDTVKALFAKGNEAYMEAKRLAAEGKSDAAKAQFAEAEVCYQHILDAGFLNWQVLYNLGNALYQQGALGKAIVCYRKAQRLAPRQEDVVINLEKAKAEARDKESLPSTPGYVRAILFPYYRLSLDEATIAALAAYGIFAVLLILLVFVRSPWMKALCALSLAATLALGATLAAKYFWQEGAERGVIIAEVCAVRFGPGVEYQKRFEAHEGAEFLVSARHKDPKTGEEWLKVRLFIEVRQTRPSEAGAEAGPARAEGWILAKDVELL